MLQVIRVSMPLAELAIIVGVAALVGLVLGRWSK
jgi:hypothetical protein